MRRLIGYLRCGGRRRRCGRDRCGAGESRRWLLSSRLHGVGRQARRSYERAVRAAWGGNCSFRAVLNRFWARRGTGAARDQREAQGLGGGAGEQRPDDRAEYGDLRTAEVRTPTTDTENPAVGAERELLPLHPPDGAIRKDPAGLGHPARHCRDELSPLREVHLVLVFSELLPDLGEPIRAVLVGGMLVLALLCELRLGDPRHDGGAFLLQLSKLGLQHAW